MTDPTIPAEPEPCEYCGAKDTGTSPQRSSVATAAASSTAASTARGCSTWTPCPAPGATTTCKDSTPMPADPTIPEIVARLRELHAKLQALQVGTPEFTEARQLFRDVLQLSAPGILDALERDTEALARAWEEGAEAAFDSQAPSEDSDYLNPLYGRALDAFYASNPYRTKGVSDE